MQGVGVRLAHVSAGRMRLKVDDVKGNARYAREIEEGLRTVSGLHSVDVSPVTGSLLLTYDPSALESMELPFSVARVLGISLNDLDPEHLRLLMSHHGNGTSGTDMSMAEGLEIAVKEINAALRRSMGGADLGIFIPVGLAVLGLRSLLISEKTVLPAWHDYLWFALSTYFMLNRTSSAH